MSASLPHDELVELFMTESCPVLALELHERTGLPLVVLWANDLIDNWGDGPERTPLHVMVRAKNGLLLDAFGLHDQEEILRSCTEGTDFSFQDDVPVAELTALMGDSRPFYAADEEIRAWALSLAETLLADPALANTVSV